MLLDIDPQARLVVSSGYSIGAEMARYKELGFCAWLENPFRSAVIEAMISEAMISEAMISEVMISEVMSLPFR